MMTLDRSVRDDCRLTVENATVENANADCRDNQTNKQREEETDSQTGGWHQHARMS